MGSSARTRSSSSAGGQAPSHPARVRNAILAAAADSNASRASKAATFRYDSTGPNLIGYGTGSCGVNGLGCFTRTAPTGFTMWLREHGRVFDWGTLRWCQMQASPTNGCYDAETIALDEFGHVEILNHHANYADERDYTDAVVQTFSRTRPKTGWNMHTYGICDTATLQVRYDLPTLSSLYSRCLDVVTVLSLAVDDTSIPYGGAVDFTSILKVATDTDYGRLSANPIGGRTIRLQRRSVGSSTWANLATLAGTSPTGHVHLDAPAVRYGRLPDGVLDPIQRRRPRRHEPDGARHRRAVHRELSATDRFGVSWLIGGLRSMRVPSGVAVIVLVVLGCSSNAVSTTAPVSIGHTIQRIHGTEPRHG